MPRFKCNQCSKEFQAYHEYVKGKTHKQISAVFGEDQCEGIFLPTRPVPHTHGCFKCDDDVDCYEEECDEEYGISECYACEEDRLTAAYKAQKINYETQRLRN